MKIILTAFGGKLKSEPMDWPDEMRGQDMHLAMDMERPSVRQANVGFTPDKTGLVRARFEATNRFGILVNKDTYEEYKLVDVNGLYFPNNSKQSEV